MSAWAWRLGLGAVAAAAVVWCVVLWGPWAGPDGAEITVAGAAGDTPLGGYAAIEDLAEAEPAAVASEPRLTVASGSDGRIRLAPSFALPGEDGGQGASGAAGGEGAAEEAAGGADDSEGVMWTRRAAAVSGCAALFSAPAEQIILTAEGFAGGATVSWAGHAVSLGDATPGAPALADAMADADGVIEVSWSVPSAPVATEDAAPRAYAVVATGANPAGANHTARMVSPVVVYPGTAPCAVDDSASTTLDQAVQVAVLANDIAPTGGSLDATTVSVRPAVGGSFAVDGTTGAVTFTPDAGFWGTVETAYAVYDGWGIGVQAALSVTVDAGCTVTGAEGVDVIEGTEGGDVICVPDRDDWRAFVVIDAKGGDDVILGGAGVEWIYGGEGADTIYANGGDDRIVAGAGADTVYGGPGMDSVYSIDLADTIIDDDYELVLSPAVTVAQSGPAAEEDWAWADVFETVEIDVLGNDHDPNEDLDPTTLRVTAVPSSGAVAVVETADGRPVVEFVAAGSVGEASFSYEVCDALGSCATADVSVTVGAACTIVGTEGHDTLWGTAGADVICGLGGNDVIHGQGGDDVIIGGPGDDILWAGKGADVVVGGDGADALNGQADDDVLWGGAGDDALYGGDGNDTLWGGTGDDNLSGEDGDDRIAAGAGNDIVWGYADADLIWGGAGDDRIWGGAGDDTIWGGPGIDELRGGIGADTLWGGGGDDTLEGAAGADRLHGGWGADRLDGGTENDSLWGGPGDDALWGREHTDELHGGIGADTLRGGPGDDRLWGGAGDDRLIGNSGTDHLDGGDGTDTCTRGATTTSCE